MAKIMTLGEVLIDLTQTGKDEQGISHYAAFPGGAPANVAVAAARLGADAGFIGKVGSDAFGRELRKTLEENNVDTTYVYETEETPTTLAIVSVDEEGERNFAFYRQPGADTQLTDEEAVSFLSDEAEADGANPEILHVGSLSFTNEPSRSACLAALMKACEKDMIISYDPNYRASLWESEQEATLWMKAPLSMADVLKVADYELRMLSDTDDLEKGTDIFYRYGVKLVLVTLGSEGVFYRFGETCGTVPAVPVSVCDTNGAGDTFLGAVLARIAAMPGGADKLDPESGDLTEEELRDILAFANKAAAMTCSKAGAIPAMPYLEEMDG